MDGHQIKRDEHARMPKNPKLADVDSANEAMHEKAHTMNTHSVAQKKQKMSPRKEKKTAMTSAGQYGKGE